MKHDGQLKVSTVCVSVRKLQASDLVHGTKIDALVASAVHGEMCVTCLLLVSSREQSSPAFSTAGMEAAEQRPHVRSGQKGPGHR